MTTSCGEDRCVDPDIVEIVESFEADGGFPVQRDVVFSAFDRCAATGARGFCHTGAGTFIHEGLRPKGGKTSDELLVTVYHELGHCELRLLHDDTMDGDAPSSIMHTFGATWASHIVDNWDEYVEKLFAHLN